MTKSPLPNDPEKIPDQPWTIEADMIGTIRKIPKNESFDLVIVRYLIAGDTRPLAWWLYEGHCPSSTTLKYIAYMLEPDNDNIPYKLITKSRTPKRGRPPKGPEQKLRDWLIYKCVSELVEEYGPSSYEAAIDEVTSLEGLKRPTVKRAYENIKVIIEAHDIGS